MIKYVGARAAKGESCSQYFYHAPTFFIMLPIFGVKKWERDENNVVMLPHFCHAPNIFLLLPKFVGKKWKSDEYNVVVLPNFCHAPIGFIMIPNFLSCSKISGGKNVKIWEHDQKYGSMMKNWEHDIDLGKKCENMVARQMKKAGNGRNKSRKHQGFGEKWSLHV